MIDDSLSKSVMELDIGTKKNKLYYYITCRFAPGMWFISSGQESKWDSMDSIPKRPSNSAPKVT